MFASFLVNNRVFDLAPVPAFIGTRSSLGPVALALADPQKLYRGILKA
jgi:hypothetical protein